MEVVIASTFPIPDGLNLSFITFVTVKVLVNISSV